MRTAAAPCLRDHAPPRMRAGREHARRGHAPHDARARDHAHLRHDAAQNARQVHGRTDRRRGEKARAARCKGPLDLRRCAAQSRAVCDGGARGQRLDGPHRGRADRRQRRRAAGHAVRASGLLQDLGRASDRRAVQRRRHRLSRHAQRDCCRCGRRLSGRDRRRLRHGGERRGRADGRLSRAVPRRPPC